MNNIRLGKLWDSLRLLESIAVIAEYTENSPKKKPYAVMQISSYKVVEKDYL